ncbi:MAG: ABC transporter substrate-binding protein, partial [Chloroflexota bacterium]
MDENTNDGGGETTDAPGSNTETVDGDDGISSMPVNCGNAYGDVYMPENSFDGEETFTISCIDNNEAEDLDELVKQETNETGNLLGAISFEPSPFDFTKDVTITIPLLYPRPDLAGQDHDLYYYNEISGDFEYVKKARIDNYGLTAEATVDHFSTFILVGPPEGPAAEPEPVFACSDALGCLDLAPGEPIRIAALMDFGSGTAEISDVTFGAIQSAAKDYGGIGDHPFETVLLDGGCNAEMGAARAYQIVEEGNFAGVIGTICSASAGSAIPILSDADFTMISPANARTSLTQPGSRYPGYFRISTPNASEAQAAADFMYYKLDAGSVGIYYASGIYGSEMAETFASRFMELGGSIVDTNEIPSGTTDMNPYMDSLIGSYADAVYLPLFSTEGIYFVQYMGEYELGIPAVGASSLAEPSFFDGAGYYPY